MHPSTFATLRRQFEMAWGLATYHLTGLTTEECLWRPSPACPHVFKDAEGVWRADWPEQETYCSGPPSIAWTTWHMVFWWSIVLDQHLGKGSLAREAIPWPGAADAVRDTLDTLAKQWTILLDRLAREGQVSLSARWPFVDRPFEDVVAWLNLELMKNASEIGAMRFMYATKRS